jgi:hypothetical protein
MAVAVQYSVQPSAPLRRYTAGLDPRVGVAPYDYHERVARAEDVIRACPHFRN